MATDPGARGGSVIAELFVYSKVMSVEDAMHLVTFNQTFAKDKEPQASKRGVTAGEGEVEVELKEVSQRSKSPTVIRFDVMCST